jgi:MFS transporter, DHA1 family, multidrug resistance protein B
MGFRNLHRNIRIRLIEQFVSGMVGNMVFPFMVIYFTTKFGPQVTGVITIANIILRFMASFYGGYMADKFGRRNLMMKASSVRLVAQIVMALASSPWLDSAVIVFLMMTVNQVCSGLAGPASEAMVIDASTPEDRKYIYGLEYWLWNISVCAGSIGGGFFFLHYRFELLVIVALLALTSWILLKFFIVETLVVQEEKTPQKKHFLRQMAQNYRVVATDGVFRLYFFGATLVLALQFQFQNYGTVHYAHDVPRQTLFAFGDYTLAMDGLKLFGLISTVNAVLVIALGAFTANWFKRFSERSVLAWGIVLNALGYATLTWVTNPWWLLAIVVVMTLGELMVMPVKQSMLADIVPGDKRATYMAANSLTVRGASILGALSLTASAYVPAWGIGLEIFLLGLLSVFLFGRIWKSRSGESAPAPESTSAAHV